MRTAPFAFFFLAALALTSCTKEALFPDPLAGTVRELGFEWLDAVESCLDSDDHSTAFCGRATWLDGTRVHIDLPAPEAVGFETEEPVFREIVEAESIRYVYNPTSQSVTLFLTAGTVTLECLLQGEPTPAAQPNTHTQLQTLEYTTALQKQRANKHTQRSHKSTCPYTHTREPTVA